MAFELIRHLDLPSIPMTFSSIMRGHGNGRHYVGGDYVIVFEQEPVCLAETPLFIRMSGGPVLPPDMMVKYTYCASVLYRKSRNPHGPSVRPLFVVCLEHHKASCQYESEGLFGTITGKMRPTEVIVGQFSPGGHANFGHVRNNFNDDTAASFLLERAAKLVGLKLGDFRLAPGFGPEAPSLF